MRLHRLRIHAFGPFAGTEQIDFDALADAGLHLIHGPTGAGKTSILDAICFALFAGVPGGRMQGRESLRSDHADPTARPEVELEFSVGTRRFRINRCPEHQVPKKRGTGTRAQRGSALLEELCDARWRAVATRADEVGLRVGELLGMGLPQFAQVMLLPQGEFTAFLRAKPDDRGKLLERLFDISEFSDLEDWLVAHRKALETKAIEARTTRTRLLARAQEALVGVELPTGDDARLDTLRSADPVTALRDVAQELSGLLSRALAEADAADAAVEDARGALLAAQALAGLQRQGAAARTTIERLDARADELAAAHARLDLAERGAGCSAPLNELRRRQHAADSARAAVGVSRASLAADVRWSVPEAHNSHGWTDGALQPLLERVAAGTDALAGHRELIRQRDIAQRESRSAVEDLERARRERSTRHTALKSAVTRLADVHEARDAHATVAAGLISWRDWHDELDGTRQQLGEAERTVAAAHSHHRARVSAQREWAALEDSVLRLREARLADIAAELAQDLTDDRPCRVCGSTHHPQPARLSPDHVTADQVTSAEEQAAAALAHVNHLAQQADSSRGRAEQVCREAFAAVSRLRHPQPHPDEVSEVCAARRLLAGRLDEPPSVPDVLNDEGVAPWHKLTELVSGSTDDARSQLTRARDARRAFEQLEQQVAEAAAGLEAAQAAARVADESVRAHEATVDAAQQRATTALQRYDAMLHHHESACGCSGSADPTANPVQHHARVDALLRDLCSAVAAHRVATEETERATRELSAALLDAGFADAEDVSAAILDERENDRLHHLVRAAQTERDKATGVLEQPDVAEALAAAPAPVENATAALAGTERAARRAVESLGELRRALASVQRITEELTEHDGRHAGLFEELAVATSLAAAVTGAGDNTMKMRLTAYVLAARLESVTTMANERLRAMSDGRYQLEHTDERASRGSKSGLGLRVRDSWTGTARDTSTLSGGESFIASLALALGLGDAVLHAAGGRRLETLLVDEGFGSLDEDSLEQVLDVLDGLRAGGRTVGIVSHVAELRDRIPAQIKVSKTASGSTLRVVAQPGAA